MEPTPPVLAKKLWNIVRIMFLMMKKGISKRKFMVDLHLMMKRGKIAGKAIGNLMFHHHSNLSCKSQDPHLSFINPREYEFSCSNSPVFPFHISKNRKHHNHYNNYFSSSVTNHHHHHGNNDDLTTVSAVKKFLEMLNSEVITDNQTAASPIILPGFGFERNSPFVRQLRITDSPFPLKNNDDEDCHVDEEAGEFIEKFYQQLRLER